MESLIICNAIQSCHNLGFQFKIRSDGVNGTWPIKIRITYLVTYTLYDRLHAEYYESKKSYCSFGCV